MSNDNNDGIKQLIVLIGYRTFFLLYLSQFHVVVVGFSLCYNRCNNVLQGQYELHNRNKIA